MERTFMIAAGLNGLLAVALGAFGAHGLKTTLASATDGVQRLEWWETAARYQLTHALALGLLAWLASRVAWSGVGLGGWAFVGGTVLFSGSLYVMTLTGVRALGAVTPIGGVGLLAGWLVIVLAALRLPRA